MGLLNSLKKNNIIVKTNSKNRWQLLEEMINLAVRNKEISVDDKRVINNTLVEREKSMSTGIGNGVAIPHCASSRINDIVIIMAILQRGIDFDSIDSNPVRIVFLLLVPKKKLSQHIKTLANIAKMMRDEGLREKLFVSKTQDSIIKIMQDYYKKIKRI